MRHITSQAYKKFAHWQPHVSDPLGGFLTTAELAERDRIVFSVAKAFGIPLVWNLAGGYQEPLSAVLEIHRNTMAACVAAYVAWSL